MNDFSYAVTFAQEGGDEAIGVVFLIVYFALIIVAIAGMWNVFIKAGKPGWGSIIPIYNMILLLEIAGKPIWWLILLFIPFVSIVIAILVVIDVGKNFGKGLGFGLGLAFLPFIFYPILGFGDAQYQPVTAN
ncbi:DUF5684 domain-containing protein [Symmachiella dynata]|uniref:Signal peptidase I n=1 Tax=Symmachiella dynata TaxID=2527995 RepID=A0A517ZSX8_9PLAN|nr:DUF5684 domain-containing protein [Symmachiella dynata]QDU45601.1 hypothetical protein Mal52_40950 [Symmachiella dynata]